MANNKIIFYTDEAGLITAVIDANRVEIRSTETAQFYGDTDVSGTMTAIDFEGDGSLLTGVNADSLDGFDSADFAQLTGATFTGGVTATGFTGNGGALTGVNAASLGGQSASSFALLSGATFSGAVEAALFDGDGSQLTAVDADTLDGFDSTEFAMLTGATFTGGVTATGFTGNGGALTGVNAASLGGQGASSYALLSGATFTGTVEAAAFDGDGSLVTGVNADSLDGFDSTDFAQLTGATFTGGVGINGASPDASNQFAFFGTNLLLNSSGSINMKYNKSAAGDDASMTFQQGFTTYGLFGMLGNNDTTLKVGTSFLTAFVASSSDGTMTFPEGVRNDTVTAYKTTTQTLTTSYARIESFTGTHITASGNLSWSNASGEAYLGKAGRFMVSYAVSTEITTGSARTDSLVVLQRWNGSTWSDVAGSEHRMYNRVAGRGGTCASWQGILDGTASDGFRIAAKIEDGTDTVVVDSATVSIMRL